MEPEDFRADISGDSQHRKGLGTGCGVTAKLLLGKLLGALICLVGSCASCRCLCPAVFPGEQRTPREGREQQSETFPCAELKTCSPRFNNSRQYTAERDGKCKNTWLYLVIPGIFSWSVYCRPVLENLKDRQNFTHSSFYWLF